MAYPFATPPIANPPAAPGGGNEELEFWRNVFKDPFAGLRSGASSLWAGLTAPANPAMNLGRNIRAAVDVLGGQEDPVTKKPLAGKPMDTKRRPVPANTNAVPVQKPGPVEGSGPGTVEPETLPMGVPMPIDEPPPARGVVKVKLGDGREFDYGAGESIPVEEQGNFGHGSLTRPGGYTTGAGFVTTGPEVDVIGGHGTPGGGGTWRTPESDAANLGRQAAVTRAAAYAAEPFPELTAKARAEEGVRVAQETARDAFERDRLGERLKAEREAQASIEDYEMQRRAKEAKVVAWEQYAEKSGDEQAAKRAAALREQFERESAESKEVLDRLLASKGLVRGTYAIK